MSRKNEELLDRAITEVRSDAPDAEVVRRAADRVWQRLAAHVAAAPAGDVESISGCDDYRALIPAYLAGELIPARRLLLEDHSRECVGCRRALVVARTGRAAAAAAPPPAVHRPLGRRLWLPIAAAVLVAVGLAGWFATDGMFAGQVAYVDDVQGTLLAVGTHAAGGVAPMAAGSAIAAGEQVRTGKGSRAVVRLDDGSRVELNERTQISVRERRAGTTITVDRGAIIVEAADQKARHKHLYVATDEALVSVTGTIFAVDHGVKGSRVSVVEGEVHVRRGGSETILHPGQQVTSRASLATVPVADEVSWSENVDKYLALLRELTELRQEIARRVAPAETRYASELAPLVPAASVAYVALPNISSSLADSWQVFRDRLATSPQLAEWWSSHAGSGGAAEIDDAVGRLRDFGGYLGDEVVVALTLDATGSAQGVVTLARVDRPDSFRAYLEQELARRTADGGTAPFVLVSDPASATASDDHLLMWVTDGLMVASNSPELLGEVAAARGAGGSGFTATPLGEAVQRAYADGTQWLMAAELARLMGAGGTDDAELTASGLGDVQRLLVERWDEGERAVMSAELTFAHPRSGIASWLAAPAPMGALDFISSDAHVAAAFVVKNPAQMVDDLLALDGADADLASMEGELGLSLREDLAAPLGGEVAFAIDGPVLPEPAWKAVVEVYDPARLQHTVEVAVARLADAARADGATPPQLSAETVGGRTYYRLVSAHGVEVNYLYVDGYLLAAPSRALLDRTLEVRAAGATLTGSAKFRDLLPRDARTDFSAVFYQDVGPLLAPLAGGFSRLEGGSLTDSQRQALADLAADAEPSVAYAYGESDRILFAGTGPGGPFGLGFGTLSGFGGLAALDQVLDQAAAEQGPGGQS